MDIRIRVNVGTVWMTFKEPHNKKRYLLIPDMDIDTQIEMNLANFVSYYTGNSDLGSLKDSGYELITRDKFDYILRMAK